MSRVLAVLTCTAAALTAFAAAPQPAPLRYLWTTKTDPEESLVARIPPPPGYQRSPLVSGSFGDWLRHLPLLKGNPFVLLYDGSEKSNQSAHAAVFDIDVGNRDLQQCADAVIRLRAEYLLSVGKINEIHFNFTSGHRADYAKWASGFRPTMRGNNVVWSRSAGPDDSYKSFRKYLDVVFSYAGTLSLSRELCSLKAEETIGAGDVFIRGGTPGHAVIVVDIASHPGTGKTAFLLAQSYMPAQQIHLLKNPANPDLSPWYDADFGDILRTPEWVFQRNELMRFR